MKTKPPVKYLLILLLLLGSYCGFSQCSQPAAVWMDKIMDIEESEDETTIKINQLEQLQSLYEKCMVEKDSVYARMLHRLGDFYRVKGDFNKGISYTQKAITINRTNQPTSRKAFLAHSYFNLGLYYNLLNLYEVSEQYLDSCIAVTHQYPEKKFLALRAFEQKAMALSATGDYQRSIEVSDHGLLLAKDLQDTEFEAMLLIQKAQSQLALKQLSEAEENILAAIQILKRPPVIKEYLAISYSVFANLLKQKKDFQAAIRYYRKAYQLNAGQNNLVECTEDLSDLGLLYDKELNDPSTAINLYTQSIQLLQQAEDVYQLAIVYNNMGQAYWRQKDYSKALYYYQKGLIVLPTGFNDSLLQANPTPAMLKSVNNEYILATLLANKGESLLDFYEVNHDKKHLAYALHTFKAADQAIDLMRWKQNAAQSKLFWREQTKEMYENAIETCYLLQDVSNAFFFFEKSRAVLLNDKLSELGAQQYLPKADLLKEQELRIKLFSSQQQLASLQASSTEYKQALLENYKLQEVSEQFIKNLEQKYPAYYQYKYDTVSHTLSDLQSRLVDKDQTFVGYFNGTAHIYILVIRPDTATLSQIDATHYYSNASELVKLCADKSLLNQNYSRYRQLSHHMYESLFEPLSIQTRRVTISPDGYFIPFELLLIDNADPASFLLHKHAFSYSYSAGYLIKNSRPPSPHEHTLLGIAPVTYQSNLKQPPLQGADFSLQHIKKYFTSARFLTKEAATKSAFLKSLPLYSVVHMYSHAEADTSGREPVLYLYDSAVHVSDLQLLGKLPTRLIVVAACNTATGKNVRGEGVFSLARGFAAAGITSSITTLWQVDNQKTYELTELFYKYLNQGLQSDEALQEAKLEFLRSHDKSYELPYFWAASILIGSSDQFLTNNQSQLISVAYLIPGGLLLLSCIAIFFYYKKKYS